MSSEFDKLEETLPRADYVAADRFAAERDAIFHKEWFCAGRHEGIANKGEYRLINVLGESILIVCDEDDGLNAFYNVCRHRGSQLVAAEDNEEQSGKFAASIRCPYHSWNYKLNGELDLVQVARMLPETLRIREGTEITSGKLRLAVSGRNQKGKSIWSGRIDASHLGAQADGRTLVWENPLAIEFTA
ncbi:MAG: Rieske 2Fe-2S domain-containing protein, partial [Proteobacteria bacterium]|nr:Rieske 2Fe-2S domain-containing protein [Pseudomonadota bacterium]